jgi:hypothetical protein
MRNLLLVILCVNLTSCDVLLDILLAPNTNNATNDLNVNADWYINLINTVVVEGHVSNSGCVAYNEVRLEAIVYDVDNQVLDCSNQCLDEIVGPNSCQNFKIHTSADHHKVHHIAVRVKEASIVASE